MSEKMTISKVIEKVNNGEIIAIRKDNLKAIEDYCKNNRINFECTVKYRPGKFCELVRNN